jgi:sulfonate transport system substrate-binding protein
MKSSTGLKVTALALLGLGIASAAPAFAEPLTIRFGFAQVGIGNRQFGSGSPAAIVHEKGLLEAEFKNDRYCPGPP